MKMNDKKETRKASELNDLLGVCGCGRPVRYTSKDGKGACNKYGKCPTYEELCEMLTQANLKIHQIRQIIENA